LVLIRLRGGGSEGTVRVNGLKLELVIGEFTAGNGEDLGYRDPRLVSLKSVRSLKVCVVGHTAALSLL